MYDEAKNPRAIGSNKSETLIVFIKRKELDQARKDDLMNNPLRVLTVEQLAARLAEVEQELASVRAAPHPHSFPQRRSLSFVRGITIACLLFVALTTGVLARSS